jgi:hypothetical protein
MRGTPQLGSAASAPAQNNRISCICLKNYQNRRKKEENKYMKIFILKSRKAQYTKYMQKIINLQLSQFLPENTQKG